jgi:hypothetical protein
VVRYSLIMHTPNPVRRRFLGNWAFVVDTGASVARRSWVADCPTCGEQVRGGSYDTAGTRKNTKDALYRHVQQHHQPG